MIINTNNLDWLKRQKDNTIDHIISDPPYLINFMNKGWDSEDNIAGNPEFWKECLRVVKPGGYCLAFGHSRTHHRVMAAIEDAGWEIRDCLMWLQGQGFPKSQDIGKRIAKKRGEKLKVVGRKKGAGSKSPQTFQTGLAKEYDQVEVNNEWSGWGSALKPAYEPIIMARKPFKGTLINNVLEWGTGGLNIDACRIGQEKVSTHSNGTEDPNPQGRHPANIMLSHNEGCRKVGETEETIENGRANRKVANSSSFHNGLGPTIKKEIIQSKVELYVCEDDCPVKLLDDQSGITQSAKQPTKPRGRGFRNNYVNGDKESEKLLNTTEYGDKGGASRFFYCPKVSKKERNAGVMNNHPTIKPIALMEWLIKLVSKEGQTILDPFAGSGSTGCAAKKLNRDFIGLELNKEYCEIAEKRIKYYQEQKCT